MVVSEFDSNLNANERRSEGVSLLASVAVSGPRGPSTGSRLGRAVLGEPPCHRIPEPSTGSRLRGAVVVVVVMRDVLQLLATGIPSAVRRTAAPVPTIRVRGESGWALVPMASLLRARWGSGCLGGPRMAPWACGGLNYVLGHSPSVGLGAQRPPQSAAVSNHK